MHADDVDQSDAEIKLAREATNKWRALYESFFTNEIVGPDAKTPKPDNARKRAWHPGFVWQWLVQEAAFAAHTRTLCGIDIPLKRGQVAISQRHLAIQANWGRKSVREFLERLERHGMVALESTDAQLCFVLDHQKKGPANGPQKGPGISVVTICNFDRYQHGDSKKGPSKRPTKGPTKGPAGAQRNTGNIEEDDDRGPDATVVRLDDHRPSKPRIVRDDQFERYSVLANAWGSKPSAMPALCPVSRDASDNNLSSAVERYADRDVRIVLLAVDLALTEMEARRHDEGSKRGHGGGGLGPCSNYFSKTLDSKLRGVLVEEARLEAEARTEMAVQQAVLKKRMAGVANGSTARKGGRASWDDHSNAAWE